VTATGRSISAVSLRVFFRSWGALPALRRNVGQYSLGYCRNQRALRAASPQNVCDAAPDRATAEDGSTWPRERASTDYPGGETGAHRLSGSAADSRRQGAPHSSHGNIFAPRQRRYTPLAKVCQHDTFREQCPYIPSESISCFGAGGVMTTLRMLAIMYVIQAGVGIVTGVAYAVWLLW
jgi:hypothetical protein